MKIEFNETARVQLRHPENGEPLFMQTEPDKSGNTKDDKSKPMEFELYGAHTNKFKRAVQRIAEVNERSSKKGNKTDFEKQEQNVIKGFMACIVAFHNVDIDTGEVHLDGSDIEACLNVFWIREQVDEAISDRELFLAR